MVPGPLISQEFSTAKFQSPLVFQASEEKAFIFGQCFHSSPITVFGSVCLGPVQHKKEAEELPLPSKGLQCGSRLCVYLGNKEGGMVQKVL